MKILVINGHPSVKSFTSALAESYAQGAMMSGAQVHLLNIGELQFNPSLKEGYNEVMPLEPDLIRAQELILESSHLVFFYPQWWGSAPALLKGFIDRVFLPGYAFKYHKNDPFWDRLLAGRSAEIWLCSDSPKAWFFFMYWNSPIKWLKSATLEFCGIKPVKVQNIDKVRFLNERQRKDWIQKAFVKGQAKGKGK